MSSHDVPRYVGPEAAGRLFTRDEVKARFDAETAAAYSQQDPVYLPEYATALSLLIDAISDGLPDAPRILDLGAGTGNLARRILHRLPQCTVTLLDFSRNMLNSAAEVLAEFKGRYAIQCADFFTAQFPEASFDAVVSSFAIHHARGAEEYARLYGMIRNWLRPGGVFACCDLVTGATPHWAQMGEAGWRAHLQPHFDEATIERIFQNCRNEDTPLSLSGHMACLAEAGFAGADVLWKRHCFAVYCAQRQGR